MKRALIGLLIVAVVGAGAGAYYIRRGGAEIQVNTSPVTRGDIIDTADAELHFVKEQLRLKSAEMSVPDYFDRVFPHVRKKLADAALAYSP